MKREIEAIYEDHVFRPVTAVEDVPEHAVVRLSIEEVRSPHRGGADQLPLVAEMERLAQEAFTGLSESEAAALDAARLDQQHFFEHPAS